MERKWKGSKTTCTLLLTRSNSHKTKMHPKDHTNQKDSNKDHTKKDPYPQKEDPQEENPQNHSP
jgi:hypothetical protein